MQRGVNRIGKAINNRIKNFSDINALIDSKQKGSILWVARLINLKHPEIAVEMARRLKRDGYVFNMKLIGNGELEGNIRSMIDKYSLGDCVHMLGAMRPELVRKHMEKSEIFLFTLTETAVFSLLFVFSFANFTAFS